MTIEEILVEQSEIVVIGLSGRYDEALREYDASQNYDVQTFSSTYSAFQYINDTPKEINGIEAVICDVRTLSSENYLFVRNIRSNRDLCDTPIIAIDRTGGEVNETVLREGVDDCYEAPVGWDVLIERIKQIKEFRAMMREAGGGKDSPDFEKAYEIPRGKRLFDIVFASAALMVFSIPMLFIALAIKLTSKGDVLYASKRIGVGYQKFDFLKFRSMVQDADKQVDKLMSQNQYGKDAAFFKLKNDPRITPIGRFIRNTSLDELPQFFNVLKGDMSIVGNRPLPVREAELLTSEEWVERFLAPAGITGMWQTSGRGKDTMCAEDRIALDIEYAQKYSPLTDVKIIFKTVGAMKQEADV